MILLLFLIIGYLFGMIHGSQIVKKMTGKDLKQIGTKNAGASNAFVNLGKKYGLIVFFTDILKGIILLTVMHIVFNTTDLESLIIIVGLYLGHCFPFYMKFDGGKGTAVLISSLFFIEPLFALIFVLSFVLIAYISNYLVIGLFVYYALWTTYFYLHDIQLGIIMSFLFLIGIYLHIENIQRIKNKTETKFRKGVK